MRLSTCDILDDFPSNEIWTRYNNPKRTDLNHPNGKWH